MLMLFCFSCKEETSKDINKKPIAIVNNKKIYTSAVDKRIETKLYDILFEIYLMRKAKTDEIINETVLTEEAKKQNVSIQYLMDSSIYGKIIKLELTAFAKKRHYDVYGVPDINNGLNDIPINTPYGKQLLLKKYKEHSLEVYLDSVKKSYDINIFIQPPASVKKNMDGIDAMYRGNLNSAVTFWELSDFDCDVCRDAEPIYNKFYQKYKDKVKFVFSYYSGGVTLSSVALACAKRQGKFWDMYDHLKKSPINPEKEQILSIAQDIDLDIYQFSSDMQDSTIYEGIIQNFKHINDLGFYGTPTIVINNRKIFDALSETEIENAIERELSK